MYPKQYFVYIATNFSNHVFYTGVTNDLIRRINEHKDNKSKFTSKYHINKLVFFETYTDIKYAIAREKQIKAGSRKKKFNLIIKHNPDFKDLYEEIL